MAKVATFSPESPSDPAHTTILHSTEDERNVSQIGMLLQIREQASNLLIQQEQIGTTWNVDKEAQDDARETFTLAGLALRNILDDVQRWTLSRNEIDVKTAAVLDLKIREHQTRIEMQEKVKTPSALFRTQFRMIEIAPGVPKWVCWLGGNEPTLTDCHGLGDTPEEAAKMFDMAYVQKAHALQRPDVVSSSAPVSVKSETAPKGKITKGKK